ncbi:AI-2E family transporter [Candidatus Peregrinibacteria bacterium]|nr:AI-2E family transporter [Candidatus Peregrinibacteria bacterium]
MPTKNPEIVHGIQKYFLLGILLLLIIVLITFLSPFIATLLISGVIVTAVYPLHKILNSKVHIPRSLSALISMILVMAIIVVPFILLISFIAGEAQTAYVALSVKINAMIASGEFGSIPQVISKLPFSDKIESIIAYSPFTTSDVLKTVSDLVERLSSFLFGNIDNILSYLSAFIIHAVVFLMAMFYFLRDGKKLVYYLHSLMPLSEKYRGELFKKLHHLSYGIIYGIFGAAILQGLLVGVGFVIVGIGNAAFWGAIAALLSPVPYIGTALVWIPAVGALVIGGHWISAIFLLIWSIVIVGLADNLIKPYVIGKTSALHPLAVLLVLLGGAFAFGLKGLLFGPFILTLTLAFIHIYQLEYKSVLGKVNEPVAVLVKPKRKPGRKVVKKKK